MGQYFMGVMLVHDRSDSYNDRVLTFSAPGSLKLTEHSWNGNLDVAEAIQTLWSLSRNPYNEVRVAWVGDYSGSYEYIERYNPYHLEAYAAAWGQFTAVHPLKHGPAYGPMYAVNDDRKEAVLIHGEGHWNESIHGAWWACAWPILNAVGNGEGGGDYRGPNEHWVGRWAYDVQRIVREMPEGYEELPTHMFDREVCGIPTEEVDP